MNDESDSRMVRLPVREMRDEPAPQRAAQEGGLPPLPEPGLDKWSDAHVYTADQMREYARLALAAAAGGVPQGWKLVASDGHIFNGLCPENSGDPSRDPACPECCAMLASSPQPEAALAVAQVPIGYVSEKQLPLIKDPDDESGHYIPMRKTPAGNFTMALYAAAPEAPAQAAPSAGEVERTLPLLSEIAAEVERAMRKFPTWPTDPLHALAVLGEEFGELTKDVLQLTYEPHKTSADNVRKEATQTAAMALRFLASIDTYEYRRCAQHAQKGG